MKSKNRQVQVNKLPQECRKLKKKRFLFQHLLQKISMDVGFCPRHTMEDLLLSLKFTFFILPMFALHLYMGIISIVNT